MAGVGRGRQGSAGVGQGRRDQRSWPGRHDGARELQKLRQKGMHRPDEAGVVRVQCRGDIRSGRFEGGSAAAHDSGVAEDVQAVTGFTNALRGGVDRGVVVLSISSDSAPSSLAARRAFSSLRAPTYTLWSAASSCRADPKPRPYFADGSGSGSGRVELGKPAREAVDGTTIGDLRAVMGRYPADRQQRAEPRRLDEACRLLEASVLTKPVRQRSSLGRIRVVSPLPRLRPHPRPDPRHPSG
jgi:hypothetical protein